MPQDDEELKEIKQQVDRKLWRWAGLGANFVAWIVGCGILALVDSALVEFVAVVWFGVLMFHGILVFLWEKRDRDIQAELERRAQVRGSEKLKRDRLYRLSDDGELVEVEDDEEVPLSDIHR